MITGGGDNTGQAIKDTVEVFHLGNNTICKLPSLPMKIGSHTQDGLIQCGGRGSEDKCHKFSQGKWEKSHDLKEKRYKHSSWLREDGSILLLGGDVSETQAFESALTIADEMAARWWR